MWPSPWDSSDLKRETGQRQINESMYKNSHSVYLTRCSDIFIHPQGIGGSFWREISGDLRRLRKLTLWLGCEAFPDIRSYLNGSPDWGQKMHLTGGKGFGIENWAFVGQQRNSTVLENSSGGFLCLDNETFQTPCNWDLDRESCLENFVPSVIWLSFHNFLHVTYVRHWLAGALGNTNTIWIWVIPANPGILNRERGEGSITLRGGVCPRATLSFPLYRMSVDRYHETHLFIMLWSHYLLRTSWFFFEKPFLSQCIVFQDLPTTCFWAG